MHLGFAVGDRTYEKSIADPELPDTSHITSNFFKSYHRFTAKRTASHPLLSDRPIMAPKAPTNETAAGDGARMLQEIYVAFLAAMPVLEGQRGVLRVEPAQR